MARSSLFAIGAVVLPTPTSVAGADITGREISITERIAAQREIERVYQAHRLGAASSAVSTSDVAILHRVTTYLKESRALETVWGRPVTSEALEREVARIARDSRLPGRLAELYEALGWDPVLFAECVARPVLVRRLVRNAFDFDPTIHASARQRAEMLRREVSKQLLSGRHSGSAVLLELVVAAAGVEARGPERLRIVFAGLPRQAVRVSVSPSEFARWRERVPSRVGTVGALQEDRDRFVFNVLLAEDRQRLLVETHVIGKRPYDEWWTDIEPGLDSTAVKTLAEDSWRLPLPGGAEGSRPDVDGFSCTPDDSWDNGILDDVVERRNESLVWTGSEMIVWGGSQPVQGNSFFLRSGSRYDPLLNTWAAMSEAGAPDARSSHGAVWTGREMIVWGGGTPAPVNSGARYDPVLDRWSPMTGAGAPSPRASHSAVWTGREMIVWGGDSYESTGGRYDPDLDRWMPITTIDAPEGRFGHTAVWSGREMIIWGGYTSDAEVGVNSGGRYDPARDAWTPVSTTNAPSPRYDHASVWTGARMVVWGGQQTPGVFLATGGQYDPQHDSWSTVTNLGSPSPRSGHKSVWVEPWMVVWGGDNGITSLEDGGRYDPLQDRWLPVSTVGAPIPRAYHHAISTGTRMIVWGGGARATPPLNTGGCYDPATDLWTPTSVGDGPRLRQNHTAVWTGAEMIIWGGWGGKEIDDYFATGSRYDPLLDAWSATSTASAPVGRAYHSAVWSGTEMIVWGGYFYDATGAFFALNSGGRYNPVTDGWTSLATDAVPSARYAHTGVWTGSEMVVWGGSNSVQYLNTGGRYDPSLNRWFPTSLSAAPAARTGHTAIWTGSRMVVWGGQGLLGTPLNSGSRYDPILDTWSAVSAVGAPSARSYHTSVWTGSQMIVWGGVGALAALNSGGKYDPVTNAWASTSFAGAPDARFDHTAVWTGDEMIVWGGDDQRFTYGTEKNTGGRYDPVVDAWRSVTTIAAPYARELHTAIWTGDAMIVWGGDLDTGGCYAVGNPDSDNDGVADACDCAAFDPEASAPPQEVRRLSVGVDRTALTWFSAASNAGPGTLHDVLRVSLSEFPVGSGPSESCLAAGIPEARTEDPEVPAAGQGVGYLVRGKNSCAVGSYGWRSDGGERASAACP